MHLLGEDQKRGKKNRSSPEQAFKRINTFVLAVNLACFLIVVSQVAIATKKTIAGNLFFPTDFVMSDVIAMKTANCSVNTTEGVGGWSDVTSTISPRDRDHRFAMLSARIVTAIVTHGLMVGIGALNKLAFDLNFFALRYRYLIVRKDLMTFMEFIFMGITFWLAISAQGEAKTLRNYLKDCRVTSRNSLPYQVPMIPFIFNCAFTLLFHFITLGFLLKNGLKKPKTDPPQHPTRSIAQFPAGGDADGAMAGPTM